AMAFSSALSPDHQKINRVHVGVMHGALGRDFHEWRPAQVADYVRLLGSARYAPGQSEAAVLQEMRGELARFHQRFPGLRRALSRSTTNARLSMPPVEVARTSPVVAALNSAYQQIRGERQPTGVFLPSGFYGTDAGHLSHGGGMSGVVCGPGGRYN